MKCKYSFAGEMWRWPGDGGWHFVNLPKPMAKEIRLLKKTYGAGFVRVKVNLGKSSWDTALFPHKQSETFILSIKKSIRSKEHLWEGDRVKVDFKVK